MKSGAASRSVLVDQLVIAGWTGRDSSAVEKHIRELEVIGVRRPRSTPIFYRVGSALLTRSEEIQVIGENSSGEVEVVLFSLPDGLWVGIGSDHTDRKAETIGVTLSKQMCPKPIGADLWRYTDVAPHWDRLMLRSYATISGVRRLYQEGSVAALRTPEDLIRRYCGVTELVAGTAMFCGTLAAHDGVSSAELFEMELEDPVLGRRLAHRYRVVSLPVEG